MSDCKERMEGGGGGTEREMGRYEEERKGKKGRERKGEEGRKQGREEGKRCKKTDKGRKREKREGVCEERRKKERKRENSDGRSCVSVPVPALLCSCSCSRSLSLGPSCLLRTIVIVLAPPQRALFSSTGTSLHSAGCALLISFAAYLPLQVLLPSPLLVSLAVLLSFSPRIAFEHPWPHCTRPETERIALPGIDRLARLHWAENNRRLCLLAAFGVTACCAQ